MFRSACVLSLLLACLLLRAAQRTVQVGLFRDRSIEQVLVTSPRGGFTIVADGQQVAEISSKDAARISKDADGLVVKTLAKSYHAAHTLSLKGNASTALNITTLDGPKAQRDLPGTLSIRRAANGLLLINEVELDEYVAGVVQSEAGDNKAPEYYKLQAVSCRTYALANQRRHIADGFSVCDGTHCQVYRGRCTLSPIAEAVAATHDMVVVDADIHLIHATFHSNCGGETMNAEDLWSKSEPYLVSARDTFCIASPHAEWRRTMSREKWISYLQRGYGIDANDSATLTACTHFAPQCRSLYIDGARPLIPLEQVRADMKFNSAWFTIETLGDEVVFEGRGFGHGVGLCQEGAMRMAELGIPFTAILHQYFSEVHLVDLDTLDFFRD